MFRGRTGGGKEGVPVVDQLSSKNGEEGAGVGCFGGCSNTKVANHATVPE